MAKLGSPKTTKFSIGTAEVRIGPMTLANKLTQAHSIGLLDNVTVEVAQESVDLLGGFPQVTVDTAVVSQESSVTATLREYSQRNMQVLMGEAASAGFTADVASLMVTSELVGSTDFDVTAADGSNFSAGDMLVVYPAANPEKIQVVLIDSVLIDAITLDAGTPLLFDMDGTAETVHVFKAAQVPVGAIQETNYFAVQVLQLQRGTNRPVGFNFWKCAVGAGMTFATSATDFASTDMVIKMLEPAEAEYGAGETLEHLANFIPTNPVGMYFGGGDT